MALTLVAALTALSTLTARPAHADRIENQVAVFSALDKVTARISKFEVALGETGTFGTLKITPHVCYSRPPDEEPKTTTFVEVDETQLDGSTKRVFTGWMFAESPGIYGLEHPTLDVWLAGCQKPLRSTAEQTPNAGEAPSETPADGAVDQTQPGAGDSGAIFLPSFAGASGASPGHCADASSRAALRCEVGEDAGGAGAFEGEQAFEHRLVVVEKAALDGGR